MTTNKGNKMNKEQHQQLLSDFGSRLDKLYEENEYVFQSEVMSEFVKSLDNLALGKQEPLTKNKQCDDNFNCDWYNDPDFPDTKCKTQCSTCFAANDF